MELDAIAGVVVSGTSLAGGVGSVVGTIIRVFIMSVLKIGLPYIDLQPHYQLFITGFVVIVAVYSDILIRMYKKNSLILTQRVGRHLQRKGQKGHIKGE